MADTTATKQETPKAPAAKKAPAKKAAAPAAKKAPAKKAAAPAAKKAPAEKPVTVETSSDNMVDLAESQMDATTDTIVSALNTLSDQLDKSREGGSDRAKAIVKGFGGENKMAKLIENLAGYMGEAAAVGMTMGATPMIIMAGTAKGIYKKIID